MINLSSMNMHENKKKLYTDFFPKEYLRKFYHFIAVTPVNNQTCDLYLNVLYLVIQNCTVLTVMNMTDTVYLHDDILELLCILIYYC